MKAQYEITVKGKSCKLSEISRGTLEIALGMIMKPTPEYIRAGEIIILNCWIEGDEEIKTNDKLLVPAAMKAYELIELEEAELKKI